MRSACLSLVLLVLAGCLADVPSEAQHRFNGSFTQQATQQQIDEFSQKMKAYGADVAILESFPPQFVVSKVGSTACERARSEARNLSYVLNITDCTPVRSPSDPDRPTSN